ncbi:MAG: RNA polymerase factor sigma-54 [Sulfurospirillaceae bacterium]|jgi:RNA polymerase sigma-54 factor|nr:RNA polymerase factor sigma-54 [Sulfurospirillaceae bacterium]MDD2826142.1 RNA polymerase factor sigma-54 [Sulfurospirillaceae bacterium]
MRTINLEFRQKQSLNLSLKLWLPLLQLPLQELSGHLETLSYENPFLEVKRPFEQSMGSSSGIIEELVMGQESLHEKVLEQITPPLFPTPISQKVAHEILCDINEDGFFDGDCEKIAITCNVYTEYVEKIRQRFSKLEPFGIGAYNVEEAFLFQLDALSEDIDDELYNLVIKMIDGLAKVDKYAKHHRFEEAKAIIKKFSNPPAVEYKATSKQVIPDFFVEVEDDIILRINNDYYPDIVIHEPFSSKNDSIKDKLKEARDIVNLLELRKTTLYKIVLLIVERQLSFFVGGELKPMSMAMLADELSFAESTISRAISNKYIESKLGVFPLKSFFTNAVSSKELSSSEVKNFINTQIEYEDKEEPLTDDDLLLRIEKRFSIKMVRRTITKYRKLMNVPSSKERKKIYKVSGGAIA